jgi:hypothetical protein
MTDPVPPPAPVQPEPDEHMVTVVFFCDQNPHPDEIPCERCHPQGPRPVQPEPDAPWPPAFFGAGQRAQPWTHDLVEAEKRARMLRETDGAYHVGLPLILDELDRVRGDLERLQVSHRAITKSLAEEIEQLREQAETQWATWWRGDSGQFKTPQQSAEYGSLHVSDGEQEAREFVGLQLKWAIARRSVGLWREVQTDD